MKNSLLRRLGAVIGTISIASIAGGAAVALTGAGTKPQTAAAVAAPGTASAPASAFHLVKTIPLPGDNSWDYLMLDEGARRLYIARSSHVSVINIDTGKLVGDIPGTQGVHGVALDTKRGTGYTSNGRTHSVTIFSLKTLKKTGEVSVGEGPDAIIYDAVSDRVFTLNGGANSATAISAATGKVVGTVTLPGRPEFAVADGRGHIFNNLEDKSEIVDINARTLKVEHTWPLAPGTSPSGLAMDTGKRRLFAVCDNQKLAVVNADTGAIVATPAIGNGPDACAFDPGTREVFSPNGQDGTITVLRETSAGSYAVVQTLTTQDGARTMTLDSRSHRLLTVAAKALPGSSESRRRGYVPSTFVVLEYSR